MIRKFFLHLSRKEQKKRFLERLENPEKNWKFSADDVRERKFWDEYMEAYEDMIRHTATEDAPWYTRLVVAAAVVSTLDALDLSYPKVSKAERKELAAARRALLAEK